MCLKDLKPLYTNEDQAEYNVTNLNNGFTVLTESQVFPGAVHMGKYPITYGPTGRYVSRAYILAVVRLIVLNKFEYRILYRCWNP